MFLEIYAVYMILASTLRGNLYQFYSRREKVVTMKKIIFQSKNRAFTFKKQVFKVKKQTFEPNVSCFIAKKNYLRLQLNLIQIFFIQIDLGRFFSQCSQQYDIAKFTLALEITGRRHIVSDTSSHFQQKNLAMYFRCIPLHGTISILENNVNHDCIRSVYICIY